METVHTAPRAAARLDRARQAAPQVFERLRNAILALELPPGAPLSRTELATQFGVSSTPIRDALMRLEEEGLVEVFPQHATVVSRVDVGRAEQAHFLRQALELEIVRLLAEEHVAEEGGVVDQQHRLRMHRRLHLLAGEPVGERHRQEMADVDHFGGLALDHGRAENAGGGAADLDVEPFLDDVDDLVDDEAHALKIRIDGIETSEWGVRLQQLMDAIAALVSAEVSRFPSNVGHILGSRRLRSHDTLGGKLSYLAWKGRDAVQDGAAAFRKLIGQT